DLLIHARWIIPIIPENAVLSDCALAIQDHEIVDILPSSEASKHYCAEQEVRLEQHVLMPGLVNSHCHSAMSLLRGYADDLPLDTWLQEHIWPAEQQWVSPEFVEAGTELAIAEMIRSGTTTFADMYFFPEETANVAARVGMRCQLAFPVLDFPTAWAQDANDYIHKGLALRDNYGSHPLINIAFGPHAPYTVSDEPLQRISVLAEELQASVQIHLHETQKEISDALDSSGERPIQRLQQLGLLSPLTQCVHMTQIEGEDIELLQQHGAHVIHCPKSNLKLASGFCPTQELLDAGVNVALGTDGAASNNGLDMFAEMNAASLLAKGVSGNAGALGAHSALRMATLNGARALGLDSKIGSLEKGKLADLIAVELNDLEQTPLFNPASHLVYTACGHKVSHSWVAGRALMHDYKLQTLHTEAVQKKARQWQQHLQP
ncbi:MAG: TRZ/ATZ family hydrolase, partial [Pseudomonadota bacterium]|nr:TRZ/ATZ family hydrolase [Pseudomonadota bacterium]